MQVIISVNHNLIEDNEQREEGVMRKAERGLLSAF